MNNDDFGELFIRQPDLQISQSAREQHLRMIDRLTQVPQNSRHHRWQKLVLASVIAVGVGIAGVGTAAALGAFAPPTDRRTASCFTTMDLQDPANREDIAVATSPGNANPSLHDAATSALEICAGGWQQGRFSAADPKIRLDPRPAPWNYPVPPLVACVLPGGTVGVFPGHEATCAALRLPTAKL